MESPITPQDTIKTAQPATIRFGIVACTGVAALALAVTAWRRRARAGDDLTTQAVNEGWHDPAADDGADATELSEIIGGLPGWTVEDQAIRSVI